MAQPQRTQQQISNAAINEQDKRRRAGGRPLKPSSFSFELRQKNCLLLLYTSTSYYIIGDKVSESE
jgi:hypothetical protein